MKPSSCPQCSIAIVQSGIRTLYYYNNKDTNPKWEELEFYSNAILNEGRVNCVEVNNV
jgi:tRNA(Arg) A34 adenosine deaminase TadA